MRSADTRPHLYETVYAHDRRKHRHRCQCCRKIIKAGDPVVMWAISGGTRALHSGCADRPTWEGGPTQRQLAQLHSDEYAQRLGFRLPKPEKGNGGTEGRASAETTRFASQLGTDYP